MVLFQELTCKFLFLSSHDQCVVRCSGDPTMFEAFWKMVGEEATVVIPGWQTMSYFSDVGNVCWFLEPSFAEDVRRLHRLVGNAAAHDKHVVVGTGSTQLFQAALFALSATHNAQPTDVVSAVPYYSVSLHMHCSSDPIVVSYGLCTLLLSSVSIMYL